MFTEVLFPSVFTQVCVLRYNLLVADSNSTHYRIRLNLTDALELKALRGYIIITSVQSSSYLLESHQIQFNSWNSNKASASHTLTQVYMQEPMIFWAFDQMIFTYYGLFFGGTMSTSKTSNLRQFQLGFSIVTHDPPEVDFLSLVMIAFYPLNEGKYSDNATIFLIQEGIAWFKPGPFNPADNYLLLITDEANFNNTLQFAGPTRRIPRILTTIKYTVTSTKLYRAAISSAFNVTESGPISFHSIRYNDNNTHNVAGYLDDIYQSMPLQGRVDRKSIV